MMDLSGGVRFPIGIPSRTSLAHVRRTFRANRGRRSVAGCVCGAPPASLEALRRLLRVGGEESHTKTRRREDGNKVDEGG